MTPEQRVRVEEEWEKAKRMAQTVDHDDVEEIIRAFDVSTRGVSLMQVIPDATCHAFAGAILNLHKHFVGRCGLKEIRGVSQEVSTMYFVGLLVGAYLAELGKAKVLFRSE